MNMDYKIVKSKIESGFLKTTTLDQALESLADDVKDSIRQGWEPQGGVCMYYAGYGHAPQAFQAMVKRR